MSDILIVILLVLTATDQDSLNCVRLDCRWRRKTARVGQLRTMRRDTRCGYRAASSQEIAPPQS